MHHQVLSGNSPLWDIMGVERLVYAIREGYRPRKPERARSLGFTDELWNILQQCWLAEASARPNVKEILSHLHRAEWTMAIGMTISGHGVK